MFAVRITPVGDPRPRYAALCVKAVAVIDLGSGALVGVTGDLSHVIDRRGRFPSLGDRRRPQIAIPNFLFNAADVADLVPHAAVVPIPVRQCVG